MRHNSEHQRMVHQAAIPPEEAEEALKEFAADAVDHICINAKASKLQGYLETMKDYLEDSAKGLGLDVSAAEALYQESVKKIEKHFAYNDDFVVGDE